MRRIRIPSRRGVKQFVLYNIGGIAFFGVGYGLFALLYGIASWPWWVAKIFADLAGWTVNYLVQRHIAFRREAAGQRERTILGKFTAISLVNVPLDYAIVGGLKLLGVSPFIGLWLSSLFFTVWKYLWYRSWVFRAKN